MLPMRKYKRPAKKAKKVHCPAGACGHMSPSQRMAYVRSFRKK